MGLEGRQVFSFRLLKDQISRIAKAAEARGQSKQAFMQEMLLGHLADLDGGDRRPPPSKRRGDGDEKVLPPPPHTGLTVAEAIKQLSDETPASAAASAAPAQAPVIVNVGGSTGSGDAIDRLASYVADGTQFERNQRLRVVADILKATSRTDEERRSLGERLDAAVATKLQARGEAGGGIVSAARVAFDKIAGIFK